MFAIPEYRTANTSTTDSDDATCDALAAFVIINISLRALFASNDEPLATLVKST